MLQKLHYNSVCVKLVAILSLKEEEGEVLRSHFGPLLYVVHVIQAGSSSVSLAFYFPLNNVFCDSTFAATHVAVFLFTTNQYSCLVVFNCSKILALVLLSSSLQSCEPVAP